MTDTLTDGDRAELLQSQLSNALTEAERWRKDAERLAQALEADWYSFHETDAPETPAEDCDVPYCVSRRNILAAHNTLAGHRAPEEEQP